VKAVLYARVSTEEQRGSGLGLGAQREVTRSHASRHGWKVVAELEDAASGRTLDRPGIQAAFAMLARREADALIVSRLDRLSRSLLDFASTIERAQREGWNLVVLDQGFSLDTPNGRAMAGMLAVFAQYERELISERTRAALKQLPRDRRSGPVYSEAVRRRARVLRASGLPLHRIAAALEKEGVRPPRGGRRIHHSAIVRLLEEEPA
jgi:DNA invertase Pin-like site-specific DNA recombinase